MTALRPRRGAPGTPAAPLEAVRGAVRAEVRLVLAELLAALDAPKAYSSRKGHGPPGYADREWKRLAERIGVKRGRWYVVERQVFEEHEAAQAHHDPKPANDASPPPPAVPWTPAGALEAAGLRRPR